MSATARSITVRITGAIGMDTGLGIGDIIGGIGTVGIGTAVIGTAAGDKVRGQVGGVFHMRITILSLLGAATVSGSAALATAAPIIPAAVPPQISKIIHIAGGCGRGFHRYHGVCVANHHYLDHALEAGVEPGGRPYQYPGYYRRHPYPYYGNGYGPSNHPTPGDYGAANQLNAQEAGRGYWGYPGYWR
jgi:hypothetical protein